ncbi:MAG: DNA polymerase I, partial [Bacteroidetes bacterium]|nr:DNA polymerase I [Bacteroidota bacterium]
MQENNAKNTTPKKIVLIDGMSVIYRSYYGLQQTNLSNRKNEPTGAIYGFINTLFTILNAYPTQYMIAAFDCHEPTFRHKIFPDYKANRQKTPDDLLPQIDAIKTFLDLVGIKRIELP